MKSHLIAATAIVGSLALGAAAPVIAQAPAAKAPAAHASADGAIVDQIRNRLLRLPYYGVFDFLAFSVENGTVTLSGYAAHGTLKGDAERAVKQVTGVERVVNNIEDLPVSQTDDDIRWRTYYAIYSDPFLSRYAPGGGMPWGHRHRMGAFTFGSARRFPGVYPAGNYPIQIIVKGGRVTLMGVVDLEADKTTAEVRAKGVPGTFGVENELTVETRTTK